MARRKTHQYVLAGPLELFEQAYGLTPSKSRRQTTMGNKQSASIPAEYAKQIEKIEVRSTNLFKTSHRFSEAQILDAGSRGPTGEGRQQPPNHETVRLLNN